MNSSEIPGLEKVYEQSGFTGYKCNREDFPTVIFYLGSEFSYIWLLGIHSFEVAENKFELKYLCKKTISVNF